MSKDTLTRHLAQHAQAGVGIPETALAIIDHFVCLPCRHLVKNSKRCAFCYKPTTPAAEPASNQDNASSSTTNQPYVPSCTLTQTTQGSKQCTLFSSTCPDLQPPLQAILTCQAPTIRHIPAPCRHLFSKTLGCLLQELTENPSWEALHALYCLPKLNLWAPRNKAQTQPHKLAHDVSRRLNLFLNGELQTLWMPSKHHPPTQAPDAELVLPIRRNQLTL